jgi:hypothetical protein
MVEGQSLHADGFGACFDATWACVAGIYESSLEM